MEKTSQWTPSRALDIFDAPQRSAAYQRSEPSPKFDRNPSRRLSRHYFDEEGGFARYLAY